MVIPRIITINNNSYVYMGLILNTVNMLRIYFDNLGLPLLLQETLFAINKSIKLTKIVLNEKSDICLV